MAAVRLRTAGGGARMLHQHQLQQKPEQQPYFKLGAHDSSRAFDGWSAHIRYFLARYPVDSRHFVAQRLAAYGVQSLLSSHRQGDLTLDLLASATDAADKNMLAMMKQHAKGRQKQQLVTPSSVLRERPGAKDNIGVRVKHGRAQTAGMKKHPVVAPRPDVLAHYPFVDDLKRAQGGGVGAALRRGTPSTPLQNLAKREIKRLAHEVFRELKGSTLGIKLSDLPSALQFLFFGDSASLLTARGNNGGVGSEQVTTGRTAKDVHLVMALAREALPPSFALAARDVSTLSSASTYRGGPEGSWADGGQAMFISERRWIKLVAHIVRRLWQIDGTPISAARLQHAAPNPFAAFPLSTTPPSPPNPGEATAMTSSIPPVYATDFQQPPWRPVGNRAAGQDHGGAFTEVRHGLGRAYPPYGGEASGDNVGFFVSGDDDGGRGGDGFRYDKRGMDDDRYDEETEEGRNELSSGLTSGLGGSGFAGVRAEFSRSASNATSSSGASASVDLLGRDDIIGRRRGRNGGGDNFPGRDDDDNNEVDDETDEVSMLRAWEERGGVGVGEEWVGAGRSMAFASPGDEGDVEEGFSGLEGGGAGFDRRDSSNEDGAGRGPRVRRQAAGGAPARSAAGAGGEAARRVRGADGVRNRAGGRRAKTTGEKAGTRPAGMWEVTPPHHQKVMAQGKNEGRRGAAADGKVPPYLRGVKSRIGAQVGAHKERLRRISDARDAAVRDVVARRRLAKLDNDSADTPAPKDSSSRGHSTGEHALDIAGAFVESTLWTRLAGGDWFDGEAGRAYISTEIPEAWRPEGAVEVPSSRRSHSRGHTTTAGRRALDRSRERRTEQAQWPPNIAAIIPAHGQRRPTSRSSNDATRVSGPTLVAAPARRNSNSHTGWLGDYGPAHTHTVKEGREYGYDTDEDGYMHNGEADNEHLDGRGRRSRGEGPPHSETGIEERDEEKKEMRFVGLYGDKDIDVAGDNENAAATRTGWGVLGATSSQQQQQQRSRRGGDDDGVGGASDLHAESPGRQRRRGGGRGGDSTLRTTGRAAIAVRSVSDEQVSRSAEATMLSPEVSAAADDISEAATSHRDDGATAAAVASSNNLSGGGGCDDTPFSDRNNSSRHLEFADGIGQVGSAEQGDWRGDDGAYSRAGNRDGGSGGSTSGYTGATAGNWWEEDRATPGWVGEEGGEPEELEAELAGDLASLGENDKGERDTTRQSR